MDWADGGTDRFRRCNQGEPAVKDVVTSGLSYLSGRDDGVADGGHDKIQQCNLDEPTAKDMDTSGLSHRSEREDDLDRR